MIDVHHVILGVTDCIPASVSRLDDSLLVRRYKEKVSRWASESIHADVTSRMRTLSESTTLYPLLDAISEILWSAVRAERNS